MYSGRHSGPPRAAAGAGPGSAAPILGADSATVRTRPRARDRGPEGARPVAENPPSALSGGAAQGRSQGRARARAPPPPQGRRGYLGAGTRAARREPRPRRPRRAPCRSSAPGRRGPQPSEGGLGERRVANGGRRVDSGNAAGPGARGRPGVRGFVSGVRQRPRFQSLN